MAYYPPEGYPPQPHGGYPGQQQGGYPPVTQSPVGRGGPYGSRTEKGALFRGLVNQREWTTGLCACGDDIGSCCLTYLCPEIYMCLLTKRYEENCCIAWPCLLGPVGTAFLLRYKLRHDENIRGSMCKDCIATSVCPLLVICQLKREKDAIENGPRAY